MKKTLALALFSLLSLAAFSQEEALKQASTATTSGFSAADSAKTWTRGATININFTQVNLTNWASGGFNSVGGIALFNGFANKHKGKVIWDNSLAAAFGGVSNDGQDPVKTDDRIQLTSKYGYEIKKHWYAAALGDLRTQFTEGFSLDGVRISNLFAPAWLTLALGFDYKPNDKFSAFISPAAARITFVNDQNLADAGAFGVDAAEFNDVGVMTASGKKTRFEFGAYVRTQYLTDIGKKVTFMTRLELFSNYLKNPQNIDVIWETLTTFKATEWLGLTLNTMLIYDHDVQILKKGENDVPYTGPGTQFKETFGVGMTFKI